MDSITFNCEVITPLFLGGADGKTPELRPPSIRGAMRWWFRAMMGGILWGKYKNQKWIGKISSYESDIFGSTQSSSKFSIRIKTPLYPEDFSGFNFNDYKIKYLGYGLWDREYIKPTTPIDIEFTFFNSELILQKVVLNTFWMLLNLGSLGARSRRGWGSVAISKEKAIDNIEFKTPSIDRMAEYIRSRIIEVRQCFSDYCDSKDIADSADSKDLPSFSIIFPQKWRFLIVKDYKEGIENALKFAGTELRTFREDQNSANRRRKRYNITRDYDNVKGFFDDPKTMSTPTCSIFGLPHQYQFQSIHETVNIMGKDEERRASPLYMKFFKQGNKYYLVLQVFKSQFIRGKLKFQNVNNENDYASVNPPDYREINQFCAQFKNVWEVTL